MDGTDSVSTEVAGEGDAVAPVGSSRMSWFRRLEFWDYLLLFFIALTTFGAVRLNLDAYGDHNEFYVSDFTAIRVFGTISGIFAMVVLFVVFYLVRASSLRQALVYLLGVAYWATANGGVANSMGVVPDSPHEWLSTTWYWSLDPLPIDIAGPIGWTPPVTDVAGWGGAALVGLQAYSVLLVVAGAALLIKGWYDSRLRASSGS
jgi:hypothetical protein